MTAPNFLQPPKSFRGLSARELMSAEITGENPGTAGLAPPVVVALPVFDGGGGFKLFRQPSVQTDYGWRRPWFDSSPFNQIRLIADVEGAGATNAKLIVEYSADGSTGWANPAASAVTLSVASAGPVKSGWVTLTARADVVWRIQALGGDGSASPIVGKVHIQFRQATLTRPVRGLPTSRVPIWDLNALSITDISGGTAVSIPDDTGNGHDAVSGEFLAALYEADAFGAGVPGWRYGPARGYAVTGGIPTTDSCSYYAAFEYHAAAGTFLESNAGNANIAFGLDADGLLSAYVWLTLASPTIIQADDPLVEGQKYVVGLMFDKQLGRFQFTVNDALVAAHHYPSGTPTASGLSENTCNPQFLTDAFTCRLGTEQTGTLSLACLMRRMVCYAGFDTPTLSGPVVAALLAQMGA